MNRVSLSLPEDLDEDLARRVDRGEYDSKSEAVRELIQECDRLRTAYEERTTEYEERIDELETTIERLKNEKRLILEEREEKQELVRFAEEQRELTRYQDRRQRLLDEATLFRRWKWKLTGVPVDGDTSGES